MSLKSGLAAQIAYKPETTWGTYVAPTRAIPLVSESLTEEIARLESEGIIAGARVLRSEQWAPGNVSISGDVGHELFQQGCGLLFTAMFGAVATTGAGPYTHTFTPGDLTDDHLTVQIGVPDVSGTVQPFSFSGCKVTEWELAAKAGEIVTLGLTLQGKLLVTSQTLITPSYGTGAATPFTFKHSTVSIAGSSANVKEISIKGNNGLDTDRRFLGSEYISEPLESDSREYSGEATLEFENLTQYNRFRNANEVALVLAIDAGTPKCTITTNVHFDGTTPTVDGKGIVELKAPFKAVGPTTDASAITAVLINSDSTPT